MTVQLPDRMEFYGAIMVRNYLKLPWHPGQVAGVTGECRIINNIDLGLKTNVRDSSWSVLVQGDSVTMLIPGCEVVNMISRDEANVDFTVNPEITEIP